MLTSQMVKEAALGAGADLCGIGGMDRFEGAPRDMDPRLLFPRARSVISLAFRIPRGVQRGNEEGTQFFQYPSLAYGGINEILAPTVLYEVGKFIEDHGWEAMVNRNTGGRGAVSDMTGQPGNTITPEEEIRYDESERGAVLAADSRSVRYTRPVRLGYAAPDVQIHFRLAAVACGLGELGWNKMMLTPQFGPMQRFAFIFTDAPLTPDPLYDGPPLCRRCMACAVECPGGCISRDKSVRVVMAGKVLEWGVLDEWKCFAFYAFPGRKLDPFVPVREYEENKNGTLDMLEGRCEATEERVAAVYRRLGRYFPSWTGYNMARCGGCVRACVHQLEKKGGCLEGKFIEPMRTGKRWRLE